jgi:cyclopropane fatty-acyl-phospholipid synthase-like methyltransferase
MFSPRQKPIPLNTEVITDSSELSAAWSRQYDKLGRVFADVLERKHRRIAEIGCGKGQLTIPLAKHAANAQFVLVDRFADTPHGSYSHNYKALVSNLKQAKLIGRTSIFVSDYLKWIIIQSDETYDAIISSEFLPELNSAENRCFMQDCYQLLKSGGTTAHSFLSPVPRNSRQRLMITADSNSVWTKTPPKEWFSPRPELVIKELGKSGFERIHTTTLRSHLIMKGDAARDWLKSTEVKASFYQKHKTQLTNDGLEVPDWIIVSGIKP